MSRLSKALQATAETEPRLSARFVSPLMRVYYLTGAPFALSNLALRRIKIARFEDLNDPFELLGVDVGDHYCPAIS